MDFFEKLANEIDEEGERQKMAIESVEKKYMYVWASTDDKGAGATFVRIDKLFDMKVHEGIDRYDDLKWKQTQLNLQEPPKLCQKVVKIEQKESEIDEKSTNLKEKRTRGNKLTGGLGTKCFRKYEKFFKDKIVLDARSSINTEEISNAWVEWNSIPKNWDICPSKVSSKNCARTLINVVNRLHPNALRRTYMTNKNTEKYYKVQYYGMRLKTKEELDQ